MEDAELVEAAAREGDQILRFWQERVVRSDGSFMGEITGAGVPRPEAGLSLVLASRITWTFSRAASSTRWRGSGHQETADHAADFLRRSFWDPQDGGYFWMVAPDGAPIGPHKHVYAQAFGIYALSQHYAATGHQGSLDQARSTYSLIEQHARDAEALGYFEAFDRAWRPMPTGSATPVSHGAPKTMNTHLHLLEAYASLYRVWPDSGLRERLQELCRVMTEKVLDPAGRRFRLFFTDRWEALSSVVSYGHDIEGSWLLLEAAQSLGDEELTARARRIALLMADAAFGDGLDTDGGLFNERREDGTLDRSKHWWPQAEALVGAINAYQLSRDARYRDYRDAVWQFIAGRLIDREDGEWWERVHANGQPARDLPKVSAWKGPYHNFRAMVEVLEREGGGLTV